MSALTLIIFTGPPRPGPPPPPQGPHPQGPPQQRPPPGMVSLAYYLIIIS